MSVAKPETVVELLVLRSGLVFLDEAAADLALDDNQQRGFLLELANLGYVPSQRLTERVARATAAELVRARDLVITARQRATGTSSKLEPMFRRFPAGVPDDTLALWWDRVIVHYLQQPEQPCVLCGRTTTIHVLDPCLHLVCDHCFDGSNYGGCPICNRAVNPGSAFVQPAPARAPAAVQPRTFALLDLGNPTSEHTVDAACRALFTALCRRTQAMSPADVDALLLLVRTYLGDVASWIPEVIPVRENRALVFGTLLRGVLDDARERKQPTPDLARFFAAAGAHLTTATDVLRLIAVLSGASVALLPEAKIVRTDRASARRFGKRVGAGAVAISHHRFKVARLPRALRRHLLGLLDAIAPPELLEDMRRHQARWIWVGEMLHPGEHAAHFPGAAQVFSILRNGQDSRRTPPRDDPPGFAARVKSFLGLGARPAEALALAPSSPPDAPAPRRPAAQLAAWPTAVEAALARDATGEAVVLLAQRPGDFLRRMDLLLRRARQPEQVIEAFAGVVDRAATPALVALRAHMAVRAAALPARVFWPKAKFYVPQPARDTRPTLPAGVVAKVTRVLDAELLRRFAGLPAFDLAVLDEALADIIVPFNERTASRSAVQLPRGSSVAIPDGQALRLFMHWCEPEKSGETTDLDLSVGFFDDTWNLVGTCSYYQLTAHDKAGQPLAKSSGDYTSAPWPDGAAEFVDVDRARARAAGYRYAVMVVNAYSGLPFRALARATAGVMLLDDLAAGPVFDARTVSLAFALDGDNGVFMPLIVDLETSRLHWLDAYSRGQFAHNNVATSRRSIGRIGPAMLSYFASGARANMLDLARYHAAARCRRVVLRGQDHAGIFVRRSDETALDFLARLGAGTSDAQVPLAELDLGAAPVLAVLLRGDLALPEDSASYALFRLHATPTLAAADLLV